MLIMSKEMLWAKKWTKNGPNQGSKTMFFLRTWRTLPRKPNKKPSKGSHFPAQKWASLASKTCFPLSYKVTLTYINIFESKILTKKSKHQNQTWGTKFKKQQLNRAYMFMQHGFKIGLLNPLYAWIGIAKSG